MRFLLIKKMSKIIHNDEKLKFLMNELIDQRIAFQRNFETCELVKFHKLILRISKRELQIIKERKLEVSTNYVKELHQSIQMTKNIIDKILNPVTFC